MKQNEKMNTKLVIMKDDKIVKIKPKDLYFILM